MELLVVFFLGTLVGGGTIYDYVIADTERAVQNAEELRIDLDDCTANLTKALEKQVCLPQCGEEKACLSLPKP